MAAIGKSEFPEIIPSEAFDIVQKVGKGNVKTANGLASVMGLGSIESGYFYHRVAALTKYYGLVDRNKTDIALTPLGERIAHPLGDADRRLACAEAVGRVSLLGSLYASLGQSFHDADFRTKLRDITQAPLSEIEKRAVFLEKLYRDAVPYIGQVNPPVNNVPSSGERLVSAEHRPISSTQGSKHAGGVVFDSGEVTGEDYRSYNTDGVMLTVRRDKRSLREAESMIRAWRELEEEEQSAAPRTSKKSRDASVDPPDGGQPTDS